MASTAWTASREELVRELAKARTERDIAVKQLEATRAVRLEAEERRKENERLRSERRRAREREAWHLGQSEAAALAVSIPPDPNAAQHRAELLAALKEKP